jgi:limonene-1,2-epoxide hydrolase
MALDDHMIEHEISGGITKAYLQRDDIKKITGLTGGISLSKIEMLVKKFKVHRCAEDFDRGFCERITPIADGSEGGKKANRTTP